MFTADLAGRMSPDNMALLDWSVFLKGACVFARMCPWKTVLAARIDRWCTRK